ncbi:MAG: zinc ribbon domain-containing protein, partial [Chitinophagaceae bacterium]
NLNKIIIAIGLIAAAFGYLSLEENEKTYNLNLRQFYAERDAANEKIGNLNVSLKRYRKMTGRMASVYKVPNPLHSQDTAAFFDSAFGQRSTPSPVYDSLFSLYVGYAAESDLLAVQRRKMDRLDDYLDNARDDHNSKLFRFKAILFFGLISFLIGMMGLTELENGDERLKHFQANGQRKYYDRCQSCGKQFSAMVTCGTNGDESYNSAFCRHCYDKGEFTEPELTRQELWRRIRAATPAGKRPPIRARIIARLDRWKTNRYR